MKKYYNRSIERAPRKDTESHRNHNGEGSKKIFLREADV